MMPISNKYLRADPYHYTIVKAVVKTKGQQRHLLDILRTAQLFFKQIILVPPKSNSCLKITH